MSTIIFSQIKKFDDFFFFGIKKVLRFDLNVKERKNNGETCLLKMESIRKELIKYKENENFQLYLYVFFNLDKYDRI